MCTLKNRIIDMKTQITILCIAAIVIFGLGSCNNSSKSKEHSKQDHEELQIGRAHV